MLLFGAGMSAGCGSDEEDPDRCPHPDVPADESCDAMSYDSVVPGSISGCSFEFIRCDGVDFEVSCGDEENGSRPCQCLMNGMEVGTCQLTDVCDGGVLDSTKRRLSRADSCCGFKPRVCLSKD